MPYPVKIYDGEGNLLRTVEPIFDMSTPKNKKKFQAHPCRGCKEPTTNLHYCTSCQYKRAGKR